MKTIISYERMDVLRDAIRKAWDDNVRVMLESGCKTNQKWQVGWCSLGAVDAEKAGDFADMIIGATDIAHMLNRRGVEVVWEDDDSIDCRTTYYNAVEIITKQLKNRLYRNVEEWLVAGAKVEK